MKFNNFLGKKFVKTQPKKNQNRKRVQSCRFIDYMAQLGHSSSMELERRKITTCFLKRKNFSIILTSFSTAEISSTVNCSNEQLLKHDAILFPLWVPGKSASSFINAPGKLGNFRKFLQKNRVAQEN